MRIIYRLGNLPNTRSITVRLWFVAPESHAHRSCRAGVLPYSEYPSSRKLPGLAPTQEDNSLTYLLCPYVWKCSEHPLVAKASYGSE